jgi:hypothetical protein
MTRQELVEDNSGKEENLGIIESNLKERTILKGIIISY